MKERIAVVGLGYVGLPVALACAEKFGDTVGFDINVSRVNALKSGVDSTGERTKEELLKSPLVWSSNIDDLKDITFFVVAVPTPIDSAKRPDLTPLESASRTVGKVLKQGAVIVYESTVYPGVTEDICGPILAKESGLTQSVDFKLGYSPERINPGDKEHTLEKIIKVVSGEDQETLERVAAVYGAIVDAGVHKASSIKVAEAAKVIENTQRDLNIALMNELSLIFSRMDISTKDVLDAAGTKWNFLRFSPGLVGGHCIGVDPYYLTTKAEELGYHPEVILAGRRINDYMGRYVARRVIKMLVNSGCENMKKVRIGVVGLTFKEDVSDLRNSRVPDIINEFKDYGIGALVYDPMVDEHEAMEEYGIKLSKYEELEDLDALVLTVPHAAVMQKGKDKLLEKIKPGGILADIKSVYHGEQMPNNIQRWAF